MEELYWHYELQAWHPNKKQDYHLLHVYGKRDNWNVAFMTTIKVFWDNSYHVNNTFTISKYNALEESFLNNIIKKFELVNR